ncbi:Uncharacterised protein [Vibrio cholerae]|nr:Uncharacterised protein [Vibrio cholerae]
MIKLGQLKRCGKLRGRIQAKRQGLVNIRTVQIDWIGTATQWLSHNWLTVV